MRNEATGSSVAIPRHWYNVLADFPELYEPYIDPTTGTEIGADTLSEIFAPELVEQELDRTTRQIPIPEEVLTRYAKWRPTPLVRATAFEQALGTRWRIYYKYEGGSPIGSHKANSGVVQAYFSKRGGIERVFAETGAGQWGSAISMGSAFFGLDCEVFMVGNSYDSKPARRVLMETFGATVHRNPSELTEVGRAIRREQGESSSGSLGAAIGEALEASRSDPKAAYALGSAFNFVCLHQTVIGQELQSQLEATGVEPDMLISCIGGGSSFAGLVFPFLEQMRSGRRKLDLIATESNAVPAVTRGAFAYDYGDTAGLTPLIRMYTLGHAFAAPSIHSGGLRYHGLAPSVSKLINLGMARGLAYSQLEIFRAAALFARSEGIIPAPEAAHSIAAIADLATTRSNEEKTVVFCLTGHGFFDLSAYDNYNRGTMEDSDTPDQAIDEALGHLPTLPAGVTAGRGPARAALPAGRSTAGRAGSGPARAAGDGQPRSDGFEVWRRRHFGAGAPAPGRTRPPLPATTGPRSGSAVARDSAPRAGGRGAPGGRVSSAGASSAGRGGGVPANGRATGASGVIDLRRLRVVSERAVEDACRGGTGDLLIDPGAIVTPLAETEAQRWGRRLLTTSD